MPPGEITVTCPGCGASARLPFAAVRRDNSYCSQCGKQLQLNGLQMNPTDAATPGARAKARRPYRPTRRR